MKIKNIKFVNHLPEGSYKGCITKCTATEDQRYFWFNIEIDGSNNVLNISTSAISTAFSNFADYYTDENDEFEPEDFVNSVVSFEIVDKDIAGATYSKITKMIPIEKKEKE